MSQISAQKSTLSQDQKVYQGGIPIINLDDENEIEDTPSKAKFLAHMKEESSYLPDTVIPEKIEKKKIVKKVRFHDDNPVVVGQNEYIPRVGTKRLQKMEDNSFEQQPEDQEQDEAAMLEQECDKDFEKLEQKREAKRQRTEDDLVSDIRYKQI